ncbi:hypothetical protein Btru_063525 [Bulinus truncatus]|nr:hypothetical protein Btru_063525 [Bulinus truncatus]
MMTNAVMNNNGGAFKKLFYMDELHNCLKTLDSAKAAERKKNANRLEQLLQTEAVLKILDVNSDRNLKERSITWNTVLKAVNRHIDVEISALQCAKDSSSATTLNNRDRKKQELAALFRLVIRTANSRDAVRIDLELITVSVLNVLKDSYLRDAFGTEYSNVLLKSVLLVRQYWLELEPSHWKQLLFVYMNIYNDQLIDSEIVARIIQELTNGSILQGKVYCRKMDQKSAVVEKMMLSLNLFCHHAAFSCRAQLCSFGETLMDSFIYLWSHSNSDRIREELIEFLHLLVRAHHPNGANVDSEGAYAVSWEKWKIPLTRAVLSDSNCPLSWNNDFATPAKRQRLSTESRSLLQALKDTTNTLHSVPWLQILNSLLDRYPKYFELEGLSAVLHVISNLLADCKRRQLFQYLFKNLSALMKAFHLQGGINTKDASLMTNIWSNCLSLINSRQAEVEGYQEYGLSAMSSLVDSQIIKPSQEIWNLFLPGYINLSSPAVQLLTSLIANVSIPENYVPNIIGTGVRKLTYSLRRSLISWVLPAISFETSPVRSSLSPSVAAEVLFNLTLKDSTAFIEKNIKNCPNEVSKSHEKVSPSDFETIYLKTTFNHSEDTSYRNTDSAQPVRAGINPQITAVSDFLISHLLSLADSLDSVTSSVDYLAWLSCIFVKLSSYFGPINSSHGEIKRSLEKVVRKFSSAFVSKAKKDGVTGLHSPVEDFCGIFKVRDNKSLEENLSLSISSLQTIVSDDFIDTLISIALGKLPLEKRFDVNGAKPKPVKRKYGQFDEDDEDDAVVMKCEEDFDDDFMEASSSTQIRHKDLNTEGRVTEISAYKNVNSFLSKENLSESQKVSVLCVKLLCLLGASYGSASPAGDAPSGIMQIKGKLLFLISAETYDPSSPLHVHHLLTIAKYLLICPYKVTPENIKTILGAFKLAAKALRLDQRMCITLVFHLRHIIPHLCGSEDETFPEEEIKLCRDIFFRFISDFWRLAGDFNCELKMELLKTMVELVKNDPNCKWGKIKVEVTDDSDGANNDDQSDKKFDYISGHQLIITALAEENVLIKNFVAESVKWLFVQKNSQGIEVAKDESAQKLAFENVFMQCSDLLDLPDGDVKNPSLIDELNICQATCLQVFMTIMNYSPYCEKKCLLGLCQLISDRNISQNLILKMLSITCHKLKYPDIKTYIESHLPYLIHNWLDPEVVNSPIEHFPFYLLNFSLAKDFIRAYQDLIVTETLITKMNLDPVISVLNVVSIEFHQGLLAALPQILIHILPLFAAKHSPGEQVPYKLLKKATDCYDILKLELSEQEINGCVSENLGFIIMRVLNCLYLNRDDCSVGMLYCEPNPPFYNGRIVQTTLDYLAQNFIVGNKEKTTLISVLVKSPNGISQVLLSLATLLWQAHRPHDQVRDLKMYSLFVNIVLVDLADGLGDGWASFIRDVVHRVLIILGDRTCETTAVVSPSYEEEKILTALDILSNLCKEALVICPDEMANYLHRIVDTVAINASKSPAIGQKAAALLATIITNPAKDVTELNQALVSLNPLPEIPCLQEVKKMLSSKIIKMDSLEEKFTQFLNVHQMMFSSPSQGLALRLNHLTSHILDNQQEFRSFITSLTGLNCLKKAISVLVKLLGCSCKQVVSASASCLGVIGPVDLQCWSLPVPQEASYAPACEHYKGQEHEKYCWLFHALDKCLLDEDLTVVKTAGHILQTVLATKSGIHFETNFLKSLQDKSFLFHYLHAYRSKIKKIANAGAVMESTLDKIDNTELWSGGNVSHEVWIKELTCSLLISGLVQDEVLNKIQPLCYLKSKFCEESLPFLIHDILQHGDFVVRRTLSLHIANFFQAFYISIKDVSVTQPVLKNKDSLMSLINVIQYLRLQKRSIQGKTSEPTAWDNNFWLDINYLDLAHAALYCGTHFSAILFAEIWWDTRINVSSDSAVSGSLSSQETSLDPLSLASSQEGNGPELQKLLLQAYKKIGDPDGIYGCGAGRMVEPLARVETYLHEGEQAKALTTLDIEISHNASQSLASLLQTIQSCGTDYILQQCLSGLTGDTDSTCLSDEAQQLNEFRYQAAWKLGQWHVLPPARINTSTPFHQCLYQSMHCLHEGHLAAAKEAVELSRMNVIERFEPQVEICQVLYPFLCQLQCLSQLECLIDFTARQESVTLLADVSTENGTTQNYHFQYREPLLSLSSSVGKLMSANGFSSGESLATKSLWNLAVGGRKAKHFQLAEKALRELKGRALDNFAVVLPEQVQLEEAKLFWDRSEVNIALTVLKNLINKHKTSSPSENDLIYPKALGTYGNWLAETKSETPAVIISEYLEKTVSLLLKPFSNTDGYDRLALNSFMSLARFADEQYQQVMDYMGSSTFQDKDNLLKRTKQEIAECKNLKLEICQEFKRSKYLRMAEKNFEIDEQEVTSLRQDKEKFLQQALVNYIRCLQTVTFTTSGCSELWLFGLRTVTVIWSTNTSRLVSME